MAFGQSEVTVDVIGNLSPIQSQVGSYVRSIPPISIPVNIGGLGASGLGRITGDANQFARALEASTARVVAFSASAGSVYAIARAFREVIDATIEVQKSMAQINAIANLSAGNLTKFTNGLFAAANLTGQSWKAATDTALQFTRQGLGISETLKRTTDALTLVRIGGLDMADSIRVLTTALNVYNETALDSTKITNSLLTVDTQFPVAGKDIADALIRVSSIAKDTGVSFDRLVGAITAAKTLTGRGGDVIGTALGTIFQRINRPQVLEQLQDLGVKTQATNGQTLDSISILTNLAKTYGDLSSAQQNQLAQLTGGIRQGNIFRALMQDLSKENSILSRATLVSSEATDLAARRQAQLNQTLAASINQTKNNIVNISAQGGNLAFSPVIKELTDTANRITGVVSGALSADKSSSIGTQIGGVIGQGLLKGLGDFLQGPGIALVGTLLVKFGSTFSGYIGKAFITLLETTSKQYQAQQAINSLISLEGGLQEKINAGALSELEIRQKIVQLVQSQTTLMKRGMVPGIVAANMVSGGELTLSGGRLSIPNKAAGFIPSFKETMGALHGGYTPGSIQELDVPKVGKVVYNTAEQVKFFPWLSQPAIMPPASSSAGQSYKSNFSAIHGFNPYQYESNGFIPSFAQGLQESLSQNVLSTFSSGKELLKYVNSVSADFIAKKGSSRMFIPIDEQQGVKIAMNRAGIAQNEVEFPILNSDYFAKENYSDILPKGFGYDENNFLYGFVEKLRKPNYKDFNKITGKGTTRFLTGTLSPSEQKIKDFIINYGLVDRDFVGGRNVGIGKIESSQLNLPGFSRNLVETLKLLDIGFNENVLNTFYRKRDLGKFSSGFIPNFAMSRPYGFWISPNGTMIPVKGGAGHDDKAFEIAKTWMTPKEVEDYQDTHKSWYPPLFAKGYYRAVHTYRGNLELENYNPEQNPSTAILKNVKDYAIEQGINVYDVSGKYTRRMGGFGSGKIIYENEGAKPEEYGMYALKGFIPNFSSLTETLMKQQRSGAFSSAVEREMQAGIPQALIRFGTSPLLISPDNPLGMGVYNVKDEPAGIIQGVQRVMASGKDPKTAGSMIPNFAAGLDSNQFQYTPFIPVEKRTDFEAQYRRLYDAIKNGAINAEKAYEEIRQFADIAKPTKETMTSISKSFTRLEKNITAIPTQGDVFLGPTANEFYANRTMQYQRQAARVSSASSWLWPGNWANNKQMLDKLGETPEGQAELTNAKGMAAGRSFGLSFAAPLVGGIIQQGITTIGGDTIGTRRANTGVGTLTDAISFAALGSMIEPGIGTAIGAVAGTAIGVFKAISSWNDKLPDLQKNLEMISEKTQQSSDSMNEYINVSSKLSDIFGGKVSGLSRGDVQGLQLQQAQTLLSIPDITQRNKFNALAQQHDINGMYDLAATLRQRGQTDVALSAWQKQVNTPGYIPATDSIFKMAGQNLLSKDYLMGNIYTKDFWKGNWNMPSLNMAQMNESWQATEGAANQTTSLALQLSNPNTGQTLFEGLRGRPELASQFGNAKSANDFITTLNIVGHDLGINKEQIDSFSNGLKDLWKTLNTAQKSDFLKSLNNDFSQQGFQRLINALKNFEVSSQSAATQAINLENQGDKLKQKFSDLANQLASIQTKNFTDLMMSINTSATQFKTQNQVALIMSGGEDYSKNFAYFNNTILDTLNKSTQQTQKETDSYSVAIQDIFKGIVQTAIDAKEKALTVKNIPVQRQNEIMTELSKTTEAQFGQYMNPQSQLIKPEEYRNLMQSLESQKSLARTAGMGTSPIEENGMPTDENGKPINWDKLIRNIQNEYSKYIRGIQNIQSEFNISQGEAIDKFQANPELFQAQFTSAQQIQRNIAGIKLQELQQRGGYEQQIGVGLSPFQELRTRVGLQTLPAQTSILQGLAAGSTKDLNIRQINDISIALKTAQDLAKKTPSLTVDQTKELTRLQNAQTLYNQNPKANVALTDADKARLLTLQSTENQYALIVDQVHRLSMAQDDVNEYTKTYNELIDQGIKKLQAQYAFTDEIAKSIKEQNVGAAASGNVGAKNYQQAFFAPLQYNQATFQRDTLVGLQDFSELLKTDLSDGLAKVTEGAKTASKAFQDFSLSLLKNLAETGSKIGINALLGLATNAIQSKGLFANILNPPPNTSMGGYIPKFASGGWVNMGSGIRDDVPAFLSGGEFVLNKSAVSKIGKHNLDMLNTPHFASGGAFIQPSQYINKNINYDQFPGVTTSTMGINGTSADITLANAYLVGSGFNTGTTKISPLLSGIGASDMLNPQNKMKFQRQRWELERTEAMNAYQQQLAAYNLQQYLALGQAWLGAAGSVIGSGLLSSNNGEESMSPIGTTDASGNFTPYSGAGGEDLTGAITEPGFGLQTNNSNTLSSSNYLSKIIEATNPWWKVGETASGINQGGGTLRALGGYIPKYATGGYFGGNSRSDRFRAMVMGGEYVMSPDAVNRKGVNYFRGLNGIGNYAAGGYVSSMGSGSGNDSAAIINALEQIRDKIGGTGGNIALNNNGGNQTNAGMTNHVTVNVTMASDGTANNQNITSTTTNTNQNSKNTAQQIEAWKQTSNLIQAQIIKTITEQSRPGGILSTKFASKAQ